MNKKECLNRYFKILEEASEKLDPRLDKLMNEDRITSGCRYYIHNHYEWSGTKRISEILSKAGKSKDYIRTLKRTNIWSWNYYIKDMEESFKKALEFIEEQENLPFEQTQKQELIAAGELIER